MSNDESQMTRHQGRLLAVFAHPDDETYLTGGTLARYAASGSVGVRPPFFLGCADKELARDRWQSATEEVAATTRRLRPDVVLTFGPDGVSGHADHVALSQIVTAAFWGAGLAARIAARWRGTLPAHRAVLRAAVGLAAELLHADRGSRVAASHDDGRGRRLRRAEARRSPLPRQPGEA